MTLDQETIAACAADFARREAERAARRKRMQAIVLALLPSWLEVVLFLACCLGVAIVPVVEWVLIRVKLFLLGL